MYVFKQWIPCGSDRHDHTNPLSPADKNLNMMPLFHVGGVVRNVLAVAEALSADHETYEVLLHSGALQGTLFMRQSQRESLHEEVRHLVNLAVDDKDQWASLIARALGGLKERFDLQQLQQDVPAVRSLSPRPPRSVSGVRAR